MFTKHRNWSFLGLALMCGITLGATQGCDQIQEICDLSCPDEGIAQGNASISGIASVDAFFGSVIAVRDASARLQGNIKTEMVGLASVLGVEGAADLSVSDLSAQVSAALDAKISANVSGNITLKLAPPKCEASIEASVSAAAECDVNVEPGMISASCNGYCEVSADVAAMCQAEGTLKCEGQAPNFACEGDCTGSCQLEVAAGCEGSCSGTCDGACSVCAGGACETDADGFITNCAGQCMGSCSGECRLEAGGACEGRCEGSCEYTPGEFGCEANATAKCDAAAMVDIDCQGQCEADVTPPEVSAECKASVEARAKAEIECTPPSFELSYQFAAGVDADAQAEFKVMIREVAVRYSAMFAAITKADYVIKASVQLIADAGGAVTGAVNAIGADGSIDIRASIGVGCALTELNAVGSAIGGVEGELDGSISAVTNIGGMLGA